jgi:hypothetical protein
MSGLLRCFRWHSVEQTASLCQYDAFELQDVVIPEQDGTAGSGSPSSSPETRRRRQERWHADHLLWIIEETKAVEMPI